ncbi:MAG: hypothetical protein H7833_00175 [Magnetococcus sp. DMHC-1]|nr:hypothetical protein [Magnetococcales bacterium]
MESPETKIHNLLFGVRRSIRYHNRRRMFFDRWNSLTNAISVIFGSATFLAVLQGAGGNRIALWTSALVTIVTVADRVGETAKMARLHFDLARRFIDLEKRIIAATPTDDAVIALTAVRLDIEADEPPILRILDTLCHNEMLRAMGYEEWRFVKIGWFQRQVAQFMDWREHLLHERAVASSSQGTS